MNGLSVVIPSKSVTNLSACVKAVRQHEPDVRIIVVDDGLDHSLIHWGIGTSDPFCVAGVKPFVFARNCNIGITAAGGDDVILLNDDALLETSGGFRAMQEDALVTEYGLISATTNVAGNTFQHRVGTKGTRILGGKTPGNSFPTVAFVCALIPRRTIKLIGWLDERFNAYGWEDNDYCRRIHEAGLSIGVCDGCFVDHSKVKSSFRGGPNIAGDIQKGRQIYLEKWGST